jgi:hypothetical protein
MNRRPAGGKVYGEEARFARDGSKLIADADVARRTRYGGWSR